MKNILIIMWMIAAGGILYACGGSGSKSSPGVPSGIATTVAAPQISTTKAPITTSTDAAKTVNESKTLATSFASGSTFPSLNSLVSKPAADQAVNGHKIISTVRDIQVQGAGAKTKGPEGFSSGPLNVL